MVVLSMKLLREFKRRADRSPAYEALLGRKVAAARASARAGRWRSNEEVEAEFATRRQHILARLVGEGEKCS